MNYRNKIELCSFNPRPAVILLAVLCIIFASADNRYLSFAEETAQQPAPAAPKDVPSDKEELKLEIKSVDKNLNGKQELAVPDAKVPQKVKEPEKAVDTSNGKSNGRSFFSIFNHKKNNKKIEVKRVFKPEVGFVDVATYTGGSYGILSLNDCINIAVKNHLPLQISEKSVVLAKMRVWEARRNMLPTVTLGFDQYSGRVNGRGYFGRKQYIEGQQPIFHGGELYFTLKQATTNLEVVKGDYSKVKNELVLQVKKGYYSLAKARENLKIQQGLSQDVNVIYDRVNKASEAGVTTKLELLNVSSQYSQVTYQLMSAEGDVSVAELILKQAMNVDPKDKVEINPKLEFKRIDIDYEKTLKMALVSRPEIKINTLMIDYYAYGKNIAKAKSLPKVDLLGSWGLAKEEYVSEDNPWRPVAPGSTELYQDADQGMSQQYYGGIKVSMPFWGNTTEFSYTKEQFAPVVSAYQGTEADTYSAKWHILDKLDVYSEKRLADIDFYKARQELVKIRQEITLDVRENCFSYEKALRQLDTATNKIRYQEKDLEIKKLKRGLEEEQDSNVVESMIKLAQERFGYVQAVTDCFTSLAAINKAVGIEDYYSQDDVNKEDPIKEHSI